MDSRFNHTHYLIRKKILTLVGANFHIFDPAGQVILFSRMKAFKLKEDIRLYTGEDMQEELLTIRARNIIDFSAAYDVMDSVSGQKIGALKRKGLKSLLKDEWLILDASDKEIGQIYEDNIGLALLRRFLINLIPQRYEVVVHGINVATFKQNFNPFVTKINIDFTNNGSQAFDKRLGIAAGILLCAVEGKQE